MGGALSSLLQSLFAGAIAQAGIKTSAKGFSGAASAFKVSMQTLSAQSRAQSPSPGSMPGLSASQKMGMMGQTQQQIQSANSAAQQQQANQAAATAAASLAKQLTGAALAFTGGLASGFAGLAIAVPAVVIGLKKFAGAVLESREYLGKYNGAISNAFARLDVQRMQQDIRLGSNTEGSTVLLAETMRSLSAELQPAITAMTTAVNLLGAGAGEIVRNVVAGMDIEAMGIAMSAQLLAEGRPMLAGIVGDVTRTLGVPMKAIKDKLASIEDELKAANAAKNTADISFLADLASGKFTAPKDDRHLPSLR